MSNVINRLGSLGATYRDPVAAIDWRAGDPSLPWLPLEMVGVNILGDEARELAVRLSQIEFARLCAAGLWLEGLLIGRVAARGFLTAKADEMRIVLQEVREEAGHGLMFLEMIERAGLSQRRLLGPTALLSWVANRLNPDDADLAQLTRAICEAAAGLCKLGIDAAYRPRNDIEVEGRKLCGTGGFFDADTLFYQGTLLIDMNPQNMVAALNVPEAKLAKRKLDSAADRIVTLRHLLGEALPDHAIIHSALLAGFAQKLDIAPVRGTVAAGEEELAQTLYDSEIGTDDFVHEIDDPGAGDDTLSGNHTGPGGTVTAYLRLEGAARNRVREFLFTGDFFHYPAAHDFRSGSPSARPANRRHCRRNRTVSNRRADWIAHHRARRLRRRGGGRARVTSSLAIPIHSKKLI